MRLESHENAARESAVGAAHLDDERLNQLRVDRVGRAPAGHCADARHFRGGGSITAARGEGQGEKNGRNNAGEAR